MEELLKGLLDSLKILTQNLSEVSEDLTSTQKELNSFESDYEKTVKELRDGIEYLNVQIDKTIKAEISKLPQPRDGKDFDPETIKPLFEAKFKELSAQRKIETTNIKKEIIDLVKEIPIPKDGINGTDAKEIDYDEVQNYVYTWLDSHKDDLKGDKGERGASGLNGKAGADGRSIEDVTIKKDVMTIYFSDDTTKEIKLPKITRYVGSGGGGTSQSPDNFSYEIVDKDIVIPLNQQMIIHDGIEVNNTLLVDGTLILEA